jgi:hypothetical protein
MSVSLKKLKSYFGRTSKKISLQKTGFLATSTETFSCFWPLVEHRDFGPIAGHCKNYFRPVNSGGTNHLYFCKLPAQVGGGDAVASDK